jgi:dihydropyrimidinase
MKTEFTHKFDLLIKNGEIVTADDRYMADIAVLDGKIAQIGFNLGEAEKTIDAKGKLVIPGALDVHTHLAMPFGGTISSDDYEAGTRAAACGGTTTVFDFAIQQKGDSLLETVNKRLAMCEPQAVVDYAFHIAITDLTEDILKEFETISKMGFVSFKVFMVYEGLMVDDATFVKVLQRSKETNTLISVHAENPALIDQRVAKYISEGKTGAWWHYMSRPEFVEAEADKRAIHWANSVGTSLYIVHLANEEGVQEVARAKAQGHPIYAETCPQYLKFNADVYKREDGRNFVCSPPIKGQASQDALWEGIRNGTINVLATDHCPFLSTEKDWGKDDFRKIPNGLMGVENMYPYILSEANQGRITMNKAIEICSKNPAAIFGCDKKGNLLPGYDADIVIYDPNKEFTITQEKMHSNVDHTIWEGTTLKGYPIVTISNGNVVYENEKFLGTAGAGKLIKRRLKK